MISTNGKPHRRSPQQILAEMRAATIAPESLADAGAASNPDLHIYDRLMRRFGRGKDPKRRDLFYRRLVQLVAEHGDRAYKCISEAAAQAVSAVKPDHYFCRTVILKLREAGITAPPVEFEL